VLDEDVKFRIFTDYWCVKFSKFSSQGGLFRKKNVFMDVRGLR